MPEIVIYIIPGACSRVTMTAMEEAGVEYRDVAVTSFEGAQGGAEYLAINRKGKVPALSVDGRVLTENAAILTYLDRAHPDAALLPHSDDPLDDARGLSDLIWCSSGLHPEVRQIRNPQRWTTGDTTGVKADGMKKFAKDCDVISNRVSGGRWWYGSGWSIVDTYLYWAYSTAAKGDFALQDYPQLLAHAERVRARPSFQRMLARELACVERENLPIDPASL